MPYSKDQQTAARIALHAPEKLHAKNKGFLKMSKEELHKMATEKIKKARSK